MNKLFTLILLILLFFPCITLSAEPFARIKIDIKPTISLYPVAIKIPRLTQKMKVDNNRQILRVKPKSFTKRIQTEAKSEHQLANECGDSSGREGCANSVSTGTLYSYIDEYSMYAVIGTGIKLPEEQIESFDGIDD